MSLPDEFADAFPGSFPGGLTAPEPQPETAAAPTAQPAPVAAPERPASAPAGTIPAPRGPRLGPAVADLPPLDGPDLPELGAGAPPGEVRDLRMLAEVQVELAVELGRVTLPLRELLALGPGAVLELDRPADAPVDVLVNGCLVAQGEVVVIDGDFGVRVTAVVER